MPSISIGLGDILLCGLAGGSVCIGNGQIGIGDLHAHEIRIPRRIVGLRHFDLERFLFLVALCRLLENLQKLGMILIVVGADGGIKHH